MKKFLLINSFKGYVNQRDITNVDPRYLVSGSQNVLINDAEKISARQGYTLYGEAASDPFYPIISSHDWLTSTGHERNLRVNNNGVMEVYYAASWRTVYSSFTAAQLINFAEWWSSAESKDLLLMADGSSNMKMWSGGITTFASATGTTITKEGTTTWAEERFLVAGTRTFILGGITYTYTGGESTTTLTGVTPDPTAGGHAVGDVAIQALRSTSNTPASGFVNDIIHVERNQVYVGDLQRRDVYVSKTTDYTNYTFTTPVRVVGEGALLTLDSSPVGFTAQEGSVYISGSANDWYQVKFTISSDLTAESLTIEKLKSGPGQGALGQASIGKIKNSIIYVSNEKTIDTLGRVENINTPNSVPLSDPIREEVEDYDVTIAPHVKYFKNSTYIAFPSEGKVLIYDHQLNLWQPPQILPVRRFSIIAGELYGHSSTGHETYKLFDGYNDNTAPILCRASFAYRNYGMRAWKKILDEWYTEGYIASNTEISLALKYDFGGFTSILTKTISPDDSEILFSTISDNSLGRYPLGEQPIGSITDSPDNLSKFRIIHECTPTSLEFYEIQAVYESNDVDQQWELLALGGNARLSTSDNVSIKVE